MAKAVKLSDIAQKLGVSTVTVSKALSGQKGVSEQLRGEIRQLADEMGYVKNTASGKGKERKSYTLGIAVAQRYLEESQSFYWTLYQDVSQSAMRKGCFTMLEVIDYGDEQACIVPKMVDEEKIDGLMIMGTFRVEYTQYLCRNVHMPLIFLDTLGNEEQCDSVVSNNMMGAYRMTNYLFSLGHKKIGFVGTRLATASIDDRYFGYLKSAMEHGMDVAPDWIVDDRDRETGVWDYDTYFRLPSADNMPTAFFCNNDMSACAFIRKLVENGYEVPRDVSVVGFDNWVSDPFYKIGLTTYAINTREMAKRAIHILVHKLENPEYSTGVYLIAGKFIERESALRVGPPVPFV